MNATIIQEILLPEFLACDYHGEYNWRAYYDDKEVIQMLGDQGTIDCPMCMAEIVGIEGL